MILPSDVGLPLRELGGPPLLVLAHGRSGNWAAAARWQQAALDAARERAVGEVLARLSKRLSLYHEGRLDPELWSRAELEGSTIPMPPPPG